jgi:N-acetylmuramoyl-L-alanine amidase
VPLTYAPGIIEHPSPNYSARKRGVRVDTVLLHHTGTDKHGRWSDASARNTLCNPKDGVSAHYLVETTGRILRLVPEGLKAWHAGVAKFPWESGRWLVRGKWTTEGYGWFNDRSVGIEVVNPGDGVTPFTEAQYRALEFLVPDIVRRMGTASMVRPQRAPRDPSGVVFVLGHRDVAPGRKTDPADNFDWGRIRAALAGGVA